MEINKVTMDSLERQVNENFYSWAWRIHKIMEFYEGWNSFPEIETMVQEYINIIRERMNKPNIYSCYYCCNQVEHGHDFVTRKTNLYEHGLICRKWN